MSKLNKITGLLAAAAMATAVSGSVLAHGDVVPHAVETEGLTSLGEEWADTNPYRDSDDFERAVEIGASAYNQNCARCHGLDGISGGIAPDLRYLTADYDGDEWFKYRVINGAVRDGAVYMPRMADTLSQEALWAIRSWLETKYVEE